MLMHTTHLDTQRQCRMFCRPIRTGFGELAVRPIGPADAGIAQAFVTSLSGTSRLTGHLRQLKANGTAGLPLTDVGAVNRVAVRGHVIDSESNEIAAAQLAIDCEVEERQVPHAPLQLQSGTDGPDMTDPQRWLWTPELAFVAGRSTLVRIRG